MNKIILIWTLTIGVLPSASYADAVSDLFNDMGATVTSTPAGAFKGQTMNHYVGGGASYRVPQKTYQLAAFTPPDYDLGCGGIDAYLGSFSHIDASELVDALQNIANNAAGPIFKVALDTISPQIGGVMDYFNQLATDINNLNINSCQAAEGLVFATKEDGIKGAIDKTIEVSASYLNPIYTDFNEASKIITKNINERIARKKEIANNSSAKGYEKIRNVNVTWDALRTQKVNGIELSDSEVKLLMTLFGSVICEDSKDAAGDSEKDRVCIFYQTTTNIDINEMMNGNSMKIKGAECDTSSPNEEQAQCLSEWYNTESVFEFTVGGTDYPSFDAYILDEMNYLRDRIEIRTPDNSGDTRLKRAYGLIGLSSIPAWALIKYASLDAVGSAYYYEASKSISADIAYQFILSESRAVRLALMRALADQKNQITEADNIPLRQQLDHIDRVIDKAKAFRDQARKGFAELGTTAQTIRLLTESYNMQMAKTITKGYK